MKNIIILIVSVLLAACAFAAESMQEALTNAISDLAEVRADNADLVAQLDTADAERDQHAKAAQSTALDKQNVESQLRTANQERDALARASKKFADESAEAEKSRDSAQAELADVKKQLADAKKAAILEAHKTCPPPDDVAEEKQEQTITPMIVTATGKRKWQNDYSTALITAKKLNRDVLLVLSTSGCPHCDIVRDVCSSSAVFDKIAADNKFVPCWITILDKDTRFIARELGVYEVVDFRTGRTYGCPAAFAINPVTHRFHRFRPSEDEGEFLKQLERENAESAR